MRVSRDKLLILLLVLGTLYVSAGILVDRLQIDLIVRVAGHDYGFTQVKSLTSLVWKDEQSRFPIFMTPPLRFCTLIGLITCVVVWLIRRLRSRAAGRKACA